MKKMYLFYSFAAGFALSLLILFIIQKFCIGGYRGNLSNYHTRENESPVTTYQNNLETNNTNMEEIYNLQYLDTKQQYISEIASYTAVGNIEELEKSINDGLDNSLTINEIKEVILHAYAYVGFPRSLNGLGALQRVLEARVEAGIQDIVGEEPTEVKNIDKFIEGGNVQTQLVGMSFNYTFVPGMDAFLKEHLFADLYLRGVLTYDERELTTISILTALDGAESQLGSHVRMGINTGLTLDQIKEIVKFVGNNLGVDRTEVLKNFE